MVLFGGGNLTAPALGNVTPSSGVTKAYSTTTTTVCGVVEGTGVVTPKTVGTCTVRLSLSKIRLTIRFPMIII